MKTEGLKNLHLKFTSDDTADIIPLGSDTFYHECLEVQPSRFLPGEEALVATKIVNEGTLLFFSKRKTSYIRTKTSIQVGSYHHLEAGEMGACINHSCEPNVRVRTCVDAPTKIGSVAFYAIRTIQPGQEIRYDYSTTETDITYALSQKNCLCQSEHCRGRILGFMNLPASHRLSLIESNLLADHITNLLRRNQQAGTAR